MPRRSRSSIVWAGCPWPSGSLVHNCVVRNCKEWLRRFEVRMLRSSRPEDIHDSLEQTFKLSLEDVDL